MPKLADVITLLLFKELFDQTLKEILATLNLMLTNAHVQHNETIYINRNELARKEKSRTVITSKLISMIKLTRFQTDRSESRIVCIKDRLSREMMSHEPSLSMLTTRAPAVNDLIF